MNKNTFGFFLVLALLTAFPGYGGLTAATGTSSKIDVVLIHDVSGSMFRSDPESISVDAMKLFVDLCDDGLTRVGIVTFSDKIEAVQELTPLNSQKDKADLKNYMNGLEYTRGDTDIGLALSRGNELLAKSARSDGNKFLILFSDGRTDLDGSKGRSNSDSKNDVDKVISDAKSQGFPIYTIGLNYDGSVDRGELERIASETGGEYFETGTASALTEILHGIFARSGGVSDKTVAEITADGTLQSEDIPIPDSTVMSANIIVVSDKGLTEAHIIDPSGMEIPLSSGKIIHTSGSRYDMYKILQPDKGTWKFQFKGASQDSIRIDLIMSRDFILKASVREENAKLIIETYLADKDGNNINDPSIYNYSNAVAMVSEKATGNSQTVDLTYGNNVFSGEYPISPHTEYIIKTQLQNGNLNFYSSEVSVGGASAPGASAAPSPSPNTTAPGSPAKSKEGLPFWAYLLIGAALLLGAGVILLLWMKRPKAYPFRSGRLFVSISNAEVKAPPFSWDFAARSYDRKAQSLYDILEAVCGNAGGNCGDVMSVRTAKAICFRPHESGGLLMAGLDASVNASGGEDMGKGAYMLWPGTKTELYVDNGVRISLRFDE